MLDQKWRYHHHSLQFATAPNKNKYEEETKTNPTQQAMPIQMQMSIPMTLFTRVNDVYSSMQNIRIIQKHLVYIIGLSNELSNNNTSLCSHEYLGQYGSIVKLVINKNKTYNSNGPNGPSYSCHATFSSVKESSLAILALDNASIDNHILKASYGTTKYCSNFLRNNTCLNKDCLYLHYTADENDIISKEKMNGNKSLFAYQHIMAIELSDIMSNQRRSELEKQKDIKTVFPNAYTVYDKSIVKEYQSKLNSNVVVPQSTTATPTATSTISTPPKKGVKTCLTIAGLDNLYKRRTESRFFTPTQSSIKEQIDIPMQISNFITSNFKRSILLQREQDEVSQYYFSQAKAKDAEGSCWDSLINTLELYSAFDTNNKSSNSSNSNKLFENDSVILVDKFNSV